MKIRDLNPDVTAEIQLVAERMRQTLVEVLGEERGTSMYSLDWLQDRVRWHLSSERRARVLLLEDSDGRIAGHAIARVDNDEAGSQFGYFSTLYVEPGSRGRGLAKELIATVEKWFRHLGMPKIVYNTAEDHVVLRNLFHANGYHVTHAESQMIQLTKTLS